MPIDREPWSTRYPTLRAYLTDRFGRPANSAVVGNVFMATPLGQIADRQCVTVKDNAEAVKILSAETLARLVDPARRADMDDLAPDQAPRDSCPFPCARSGRGPNAGQLAESPACGMSRTDDHFRSGNTTVYSAFE